MLVRLCNEANNETLQEFLVKQTVESARVGKFGMVFHLDIETVMLRFLDQEESRKFTAMVSTIRYI